MAKEWTDEEVTAQIREAVQIVREDRLEAFLRGRFPATNDADNNTNPPKSGDNGNGAPAGETKKRSLFWGETE